MSANNLDTDVIRAKHIAAGCGYGAYTADEMFSDISALLTELDSLRSRAERAEGVVKAAREWAKCYLDASLSGTSAQALRDALRSLDLKGLGE